MAKSAADGDDVNRHDDLKLTVPGRICLFGEHSDWAGSFTRFNSDITPGITIVVGTNQGIHARVRKHPTSMILTATRNDGTRDGPFEIPMEKKALLAVAKEGGFWSYAAGVGYKILTDYRVGGIVIDNYLTDLPICKGLSSSAAFCVLVARAFNRVYDIKMTTRGEMEYAYQGELVTPSRCGRMDQGCAFGCRPVVMHYDGEFMDVEAVSLKRSAQPLHYLVVDLKGEKSTTKILTALQGGYPFPQTDEAKAVHELLGPRNKSICERATAALIDGDPELLGALMRESQAAWDELGIPACPSQLTAPLLHSVLEHASLQPLIHGGKGVGSQGDGTCQLLCKSVEAREEATRIIEREFGMDTLSLSLEAGAGVRTGIIPAAGFAAGLFPASRVVKPELFPVIDQDGVTKPAILINVEELLNSGIDRVIIVCQREDVPLFERLFMQPDTPQNFHKLSKEAQAYARNITSIGEKITLVVQDRQEGFGHALHCCQEHVGDEPFVLMIGKHIYRSDSTVPCVKQLLDAFDRHGSSIMGLKRSAADQVSMFGTVAGKWNMEEGNIAGGYTASAPSPHDDAVLCVTEVHEKPSLALAQSKLAMHPGDPRGEFLTAFGQYVLTPKIFEYLAEDIQNNIRSGSAGEFQLTSVLDRLRQEEGLYGFEVKGNRFNISNANSYSKTILEFCQPNSKGVEAAPAASE